MTDVERAMVALEKNVEGRLDRWDDGHISQSIPSHGAFLGWN
jgi:hypothetical protein